MKTLMNVSKVVVIIALVGFACTLVPSSVQAQASGASDLDITLPDIVVLHYFSDIDIDISAAALGTFLYGTASGEIAINEGTAAPAAGGFTQDLTMTATAPTGDPSAVDLTLQNAWAVSSVRLWGAGAQTEVRISITDATLTHGASGDTITISSGEVSSGGLGPAASIQFDPTGLFTPRYGDVTLELDLTNATWGGVYEDGEFTLEAENI
jgi:hypothetical protein